MIENENSKKAGHEVSDNSQACCPSGSAGGDCCPSASTETGKKWKTVVFIVIVAAAGVVLARSLLNRADSTTGQQKQAFAAIQFEAASNTPSSPDAAPDIQVPDESKAGIDSSPTTKPTLEQAALGDSVPALWGQPLDSLASLNKVAMNSDGVFILFAGDDEQTNQSAMRQIETAAGKIQAGGKRISAFKLKKGTQDYAQVANQFSPPCVLAMVKGCGASGVSGEITETKLIQAFVTASQPSSGCCPPGVPCGPRR